MHFLGDAQFVICNQLGDFGEDVALFDQGVGGAGAAGVGVVFFLVIVFFIFIFVFMVLQKLGEAVHGPGVAREALQVAVGVAPGAEL